MKGANDTKTIGLCNWSLEKISPTVPPATERKALPKNPLKKRVMMRVSIFCARADGMVQIRNIDHETR